jgi:hypothetical protein
VNGEARLGGGEGFKRSSSAWHFNKMGSLEHGARNFRAKTQGVSIPFQFPSQFCVLCTSVAKLSLRPRPEAPEGGIHRRDAEGSKIGIV